MLAAAAPVGTNDFVLRRMSSGGNLLPVTEATLALSLHRRGLEPLERKATLGTDGYWRVAEMPIPQAGRWHVRVEAATALQR